MINNTFYVEIPDYIDNIDLITYFDYIKDNYQDIFKNLKFGDLIENGNESGYRSNGLYIVDKDENNLLKLDNLSIYPDDYGTIPLNFEGFTLLEPGFQFENIRDPRCKSYMHNNLAPINLLFLLKQIWKKNKIFKNYCEFIYNNKKYITISESGLSDLLQITEKIIYGRIYTTIIGNYGEWNNNIYIYELEDNEKDNFLSIYDKILFI
jgi:hypothetical protein